MRSKTHLSCAEYRGMQKRRFNPTFHGDPRAATQPVHKRAAGLYSLKLTEPSLGFAR